MTVDLTVKNIIDLTVNYNADEREQALTFEPRPRGDNFSPEYSVSVGKRQLRDAVQNIEKRVQQLLRLACNGQSRREVGIEKEAANLSALIFGGRGFVDMVPPAALPCIRTYRDEAADIPWETLEEYYGVCRAEGCSSSGRIRFVSYHRPGRKYCPDCGKVLEVAGGKLAIDRGPIHTGRGGNRLEWDGGREFLLVIDPTENLCRVPADVSDPREKQWARDCREHVTQVADCLNAAGYRVILLSGRAATKSRLLEKACEPGVAGLYFFGHGRLPKEGGPGQLLLAAPSRGGRESDSILSAQEIEEAAPLLRFVFLNACRGAAAANGWSPGQRSLSVAEAFARGHRIVIAPMWSTFKIQAARTAVEFFREATTGQSLSLALRNARKRSLDRYESGEPDISWMSYRYLGPEGLALPRPGSRMPPEQERRRCAVRVFRDDGRIDTELFGFGVESVLFRAGKRRYLWGRSAVTTTDLIAGLCRRGGLTRLLLHELGFQPDAVYEELLKLYDTDPPDAEQQSGYDRRREEFQSVLKHRARREEPGDEVSGDEEQRPAGTWLASGAAGETDGGSVDSTPAVERDDEELQTLIARCGAASRDDLTPAVDAVLLAADEQSQSSGGDRTAAISEFGVLQALMRTQDWPSLPGVLPPAEEFARLLEDGRWREDVDENASLKLDDLSETARKVVRTTHELSQQRGRFPLSNRLMLASFLIDGDSEPSRLVESSHVHVKARELGEILIDAARAVGSGAYPLTHEAARGSLLPALKRARELMRKQNGSAASLITDHQLFAAYCETAPGSLKKALREMPPKYNIDLDVLAQLARGERLAGRRLLPGVSPVPLPDDSPTPAGLSVQPTPSRIGSGPSLKLRDEVPNTHPGDAGLNEAWVEESDFEPDCWKVVLIACEWACVQSAAETLPAHLLAAMLQDPRGRAARAVRKMGFELDVYTRRILLSILPRITGGVETPKFRLSAESRAILAAARRRADIAGRSRASLDDLLIELVAAHDELVETILLHDGVAGSLPGID